MPYTFWGQWLIPAKIHLHIITKASKAMAVSFFFYQKSVLRITSRACQASPPKKNTIVTLNNVKKRMIVFTKDGH